MPSLPHRLACLAIRALALVGGLALVGVPILWCGIAGFLAFDLGLILGLGATPHSERRTNRSHTRRSSVPLYLN